jgi:hypothetical protein
MAICLMYMFYLFYFGIQSLFYMYGIFLYAHWNIYEMYNFSMQWQISFSNFLLFNLDVTCRYINKMLYSQLDILIDFCK